MPGAKIPVLEIENLFITEDGRGLILYNDATNCVIQSGTPWTGVYNSSNRIETVKFFPAASSMGWLRVRYISGNTYGPTGASAYIPIFRNLNVNTA